MRIAPFLLRGCVLAALMLTAACASSGGSTGRSDLITREEILAMPTPDLLEVVRRIRPRWLQTGPRLSMNTPQAIVVYQDDLNLGGPEALTRIPKESVLSIRLLSAAQAGTLPGLGSQHVEHAIVVQTRRDAQ